MGAYFHENNYRSYADHLVPIGKIKSSDGYVLLVGDVQKSGLTMNIHGFLVLGFNNEVQRLKITD